MDKYSDDHIWECIRNAKITDYIEKMPNGLQTQIETDGLGLSNGEKQVISCLRGLLGIFTCIFWKLITVNVCASWSIWMSCVYLNVLDEKIICHKIHICILFMNLIIKQNNRLSACCMYVLSKRELFSRTVLFWYINLPSYILGDSRIVILDEATSHLGARLDDRIDLAFRSRFEDYTVLMNTHNM